MPLVDLSETALNALISRVNDGRRAGKPAPEAALVDSLFEPDRRLAVYVARAPAKFENHILGRFAGQWGVATLRGRLAPATPWGGPFGFPAMIWDPAGDEATVSVLTAPAMGAQWRMLDAFAELGFTRVLAPCLMAGGDIVIANLYEPRRLGG